MTRLRPSRTTLWILLANLAIVVPLAFILNVWQDEAYSISTTSGSLAHTIHQAIFFEQNPPFYFVALWFWRHVSEGYAWGRFLSIAATTATIGIVPALARRYVPLIPAAYVTLVVAFNPLTIWAAVEMRSYALAMLLGALVMLTAYDAFAGAGPRWRGLLAFVLVGAISAYTQYFILFLVAGCGIVLACLRLWKALARYVAAGVAMLVLFVPMLLILPTQLSAFRGAYVGPANLLVSFEQLGKIFFLQILPIDELPHRALVGAVIVVVAGVALFLGRKQLRGGGPFLAPALLAASGIVYAIAVYALGAHFGFRYGAFLFVPAVLTVFSVPGWLAQPARQRTVIAMTAVLVAISAVALANTYRAGAKAGDWRRVAAYLGANVKGSEPIVVFQAENAVPLAYYYRGPGRIVALPHPVNFESYDVAQFVVHDAGDVRATLARVGNPSEIWLVEAGGCRSLNVRYGCGVVEAYVAAHYRTVEERRFYRATVRLLRRSN